MTGPGTCPTCGRALDEHDRHVRLRLPDAVLATTGADLPDGTWMDADTAEGSVLLQVPGHPGGFVRCLLPVSLTGGHRVTYGVWLQVDEPTFLATFERWWSDALYPSIVLDGRLANRLPLAEVHLAPAVAVVRDPDHTPYLDRSPDPTLTRVLTRQWPHDEVLATLPPNR